MSHTENWTIPSATKYLKSIEPSSLHSIHEIEEKSWIITEIRDYVMNAFMSAVLLGQEIAEETLRGILNLKKLSIDVITRMEDFLYRGGTPKDSERAAAFILADNVTGSVIFKDGKEVLLDDRRKPGTRKPGELGEAYLAWQAYQVDSNASKALEALVELCDLVINSVQSLGLGRLLKNLNNDTGHGKDLGQLATILMQVAEYKFGMRYFLNKGHKDEDAEKQLVDAKLGQFGLDAQAIVQKYDGLVMPLMHKIHEVNTPIVANMADRHFKQNREARNLYLRTFLFSFDEARS